MVVVLDRLYPHRRGMVTGKDRNPLNEVEPLCDSLMNSGGDVKGNSVIRWIPDSSVRKLKVGDKTWITEAGFERLPKAFFAERKSKLLQGRSFVRRTRRESVPFRVWLPRRLRWRDIGLTFREMSRSGTTSELGDTMISSAPRTRGLRGLSIIVPPGRQRTLRSSGLRSYFLAAVLGLSAMLGAVAPISPASGGVSASAVLRTQSASVKGCPWVGESRRHLASPAALARKVTQRMTLSQKASFVVLSIRGAVENSNIGVPSLCVPALTLTDGPDGVGNVLTGVTQFPAAISVAASFNPAIARSLGAAMGEEARDKGFDVLQGPDLNLARVPLSGRVYEGYGEDPDLISVMGVAAIEGIQSTRVMAEAKHFAGYTQETARGRVNQLISSRVLAELYDPPFRAAVSQAHVASIMCAMGSLNGVNDCSSPFVYATLRSWGFEGFTRTDYRAVRSVASAFAAGLSMVKPGSAPQIIRLVRSGKMSMATLNRAVTAVLTQMFQYGLIAHPRLMALDHKVNLSAHAKVALRAAEAGIVLLKNEYGMLPLTRNVGSIAVIGSDAQTAPFTSGAGSSRVKAPYLIRPLEAIKSAWGPRVKVTYSPGGPRWLELDQLQFINLLSGTPLRRPTRIRTVGEPGKADLKIDFAEGVTSANATANHPGNTDGWSRWRVVMAAPRSGLYEFSLQEVGDTWFSMNGKVLFASPGLHGPAISTVTVPLVSGRHYTFSARWFRATATTVPKFGIRDVTPEIAAAVAAARKAKVAIVFAGSFSTEGSDQLSLSLVGDANALISAVAAVNPRTIVVLNTGGAVHMPWLGHVQAVLEAWYPGQMDGAAVAEVLSGAVDPSGHLPISFPASETPQPVNIGASYPGINSVVNFSAALDVGYRWFQTQGVTPLFPFGYGLSYTAFHLSSASLLTIAGGVSVRVNVTNTGSRAGADLVQAYVHYPQSTGEPPLQLRAFAQVALAVGQTRTITLSIPSRGFEVYIQRHFTVEAGSYGIDLGSSSSDLPIHLTTQLA